MAGASIPYPVNYIINLSVILLFALVLLCTGLYQLYKSQDARARRRLLTGRQCLSLDMTGRKARWPPKKVERVIKMNELKRQQEAENEYVIATAEAQLSAIRLRGDESRKSSMVGAKDSATNIAQPADNAQSTAHDVKTSNTHKRTSFADTAPAESAAVPVLMLPDDQNVGTGGGTAEGNLDTADGSEEFLVAEIVASAEMAPAGAGSVVPILMLPNEQNVETGADDITEGDPDPSEEFAGATAETPSERKVGQSQNNASTSIVSIGTQTSPRDEVEEEELDTGSVEGSFDDSDMSV